MDGAYVDENYLETFGLELVAGRGIQPEDRDPFQRVAVVSAAMAAEYWPGADAVGREFRTSWGGEPFRIVGVVEDYKVDTPGEAPKAYLHLPLARTSTFANFVVRTDGPAEEALPLLERELRAIDPDLVFLETGAMRRMGDVRLFPIRAGAGSSGPSGSSRSSSLPSVCMGSSATR